MQIPRMQQPLRYGYRVLATSDTTCVRLADHSQLPETYGQSCSALHKLVRIILWHTYNDIILNMQQASNSLPMMAQ